jgi:predicted Zn-dependent protease
MRTARIDWALSFLLGISCAASGAQALSGSSPQSAQDQLKIGTALTRSGKLQDAIPHLLAARQSGADSYASSFNLAICYLGTGDYHDAVQTLEVIRASLVTADPRNASVNNLLAQAYLGDGRETEAWQTFERAAAASPKDEKLYDYMADACTDHHDYELGLRVVDAGLRQLPDSPRLHYQRGMFLGPLDRIAEARPEFERAAALSPNTYIGILARVQEDLYDEKYSEALGILRAGIKAGQSDYRMLSLLGTVLLHQGASPGTAEFVEAQNALEESARQRGDDPATQIALGKIYLMEGRPRDAAKHLEWARPLDPENAAIYVNLAQAYRQLGERDKVRDCQTRLSQLINKQSPAATPGR